jgi:anti-sigma B factor antagonist
MSNLTTTVRRISAVVSVIDIQGDITAQSEETLMAAYAQANDNGTRAIVLNFDGLDYMNSSGIGLLVTMLIRAQREKQQLLAYGLSEHYQQIFELTRLNEAIGIHENETVALTAVATPA